ncbi:serine/threonine protein kinase [Pendulispora brunnea]|uniref:Serine/threonine protein kinase n=1 Tax=Pendulispora brunnea TaxID=2905690 RepID=A0ABZ2KGQ5_9BACT
MKTNVGDSNTGERSPTPPAAAADPTLVSASDARVFNVSPGQRIGGLDGLRFELLERLGTGGMAVVFLARDRILDRRVAIKFLTNAALSTAEALERVQVEAQACARLSHENIVRLFDVGQDKGMPFLVMEYLEGRPLDEVIRDDACDPGRAVQIMMDVARGLSHAHRAGIVHRDLKPSNVIIDKHGIAKILDFGIATMSTGNATPDWGFSGTPRYMAPEQWKGEPQDRRTDIWAAGVMFFELLTGISPFGSGDALEVRNAVLSKVLSPSVRDARPELPFEVDRIAQRAMKKRAADRFGTADELFEALVAFGDTMGRDQTSRIPNRKHSVGGLVARSLAGALALSLVVIGVRALVSRDRQADENPTSVLATSPVFELSHLWSPSTIPVPSVKRATPPSYSAKPVPSAQRAAPAEVTSLGQYANELEGDIIDKKSVVSSELEEDIGEKKPVGSSSSALLTSY